MAFKKGNKTGKAAAKSAAKPEKENLVVEEKQTEPEVKDADIVAALNQAQAEKAKTGNKEALNKPLVKEYVAPAGVSVYHVWNMSQNPILLRTASKEIEVISRECKAIDADTFETLTKIQYIRDLLDKGLLRADKKVDTTAPLRKDISVEKAPEALTSPIVRTDGNITISAEPKLSNGQPFKAAGTVEINL